MTDLSELRNSANETARVARGNLLLFLVVGLYIGLLIVRTDDALLLTAGRIDLPLMQIGVPINTFYAVAPVLFLLLHLNLLLRLSRLAEIARLLRRRIEALDDRETRRAEAALIYPFDFLQLFFYRTARGTDEPAPPMRRIWQYLRHDHRQHGNMVPLMTVVIVPVFLFPLALLAYLQLRFLPYQSEVITLVHQAVITLDIGLQVIFILYLGAVRNFLAAIRGSFRERLAWWGAAIVIPPYVVGSLLFVWWVAVVPESWIERHRPFPERVAVVTAATFGDWWRADLCRRARIARPPYFRRFLYLPNTSVSAQERPHELIAAYVRKGGDPAEAWKFVDELDLSERSLRYGWFEGAEFWRTNLTDADLRCARFRDATLREAVLDGAQLHQSDFRSADLSGARLTDVTAEHARFHDAILERARLDDATFRGGQFRDAWFGEAVAEDATFLGTDLRGADFRGASFTDTTFIGANLFRARFHLADLEDTEFLGTSLNRAQFHGANLRDTKFVAASLVRAQFYGAGLRGLEMSATDARRAGLYGADARSLDIGLSDLSGVQWTRPDDWHAIRSAMENYVRSADSAPSAVRELMEDLPDRIKDDFYSRGLKRLKRMECVWTRREGPFVDQRIPPGACVQRLADTLVEMACGGGDEHLAAGVVRIQRAVDSWMDAGTGLELVAAHARACPAVSDDDRNKICSELDDWFEEPNESGAIPEHQRRPFEQRWTHTVKIQFCSPL